jgi:hypothetical protein
MTMAQAIYLLDANVFVEAARRYYAFDLQTKFWDILADHASGGAIESLDRVKHELDGEGDDLSEWADRSFVDAFCSTDRDDVVESYGRVMTWVQEQPQFSRVAKADFAAAADGWLVAYALVEDRVIVTHEVLAPEAKRRVPLPNVCQHFRVRWIDTFTMLRELGARFT